MSQGETMNHTELGRQLSTTMRDLESGNIRLPMAREISNTAGKMIKLYAFKLEYNKFMKISDTIPFWD